jgi:hypothetical protein
MPQKRFFGAAAVCASAVAAGIIESSSGSAIVTPMPRRNVRRGSACFLMNVTVASLPPLKWHAVDHAEDEIGEPVPLPGGALHDPTDGRHIGVGRLTADAVHQQLLG